MSNRHERRRAGKVGMIKQQFMSLEDLRRMPIRCAWAGCGANTTNPDDRGWSKMLLYKGKTELNFLKINARLMARDCVLCPEHARYLDEHLLVDIGGQLREVMGSA